MTSVGHRAVRLKHLHHVRAWEVCLGDVTLIGEIVELRDPPRCLAGSHVSVVVSGAWGALITETLMRDCWVALAGMVDPAERGIPAWDCRR